MAQAPLKALPLAHRLRVIAFQHTRPGLVPDVMREAADEIAALRAAASDYSTALAVCARCGETYLNIDCPAFKPFLSPRQVARETCEYCGNTEWRITGPGAA